MSENTVKSNKKIFALPLMTVLLATSTLAHMSDVSSHMMYGTGGMIIGTLVMLTLWILAILGIIYLWQKITKNVEGEDE